MEEEEVEHRVRRVLQVQEEELAIGIVPGHQQLVILLIITVVAPGMVKMVQNQPLEVLLALLSLDLLQLAGEEMEEVARLLLEVAGLVWLMVAVAVVETLLDQEEREDEAMLGLLTPPARLHLHLL
jgi:hypothetical protein